MERQINSFQQKEDQPARMNLKSEPIQAHSQAQMHLYAFQSTCTVPQVMVL